MLRKFWGQFNEKKKKRTDFWLCFFDQKWVMVSIHKSEHKVRNLSLLGFVCGKKWASADVGFGKIKYACWGKLLLDIIRKDWFQKAQTVVWTITEISIFIQQRHKNSNETVSHSFFIETGFQSTLRRLRQEPQGWHSDELFPYCTPEQMNKLNLHIAWHGYRFCCLLSHLSSVFFCEHDFIILNEKHISYRIWTIPKTLISSPSALHSL